MHSKDNDTPDPPSPQPPVASNQTQAKARGAVQPSADQLQANAERASESAGRALSVPNQTLANARKARLAAADRAARASAAASSKPDPDS